MESRENIVIERESAGFHVRLEAVPLGADWNVSITGGDRPHIGALALGTPYQKPDRSYSACASVLALPTHKEDGLAKRAAELLAKKCRHTVAVSCGLHVDHIAPDQIAGFVALAESAVNEFCGMLENSV